MAKYHITVQATCIVGNQTFMVDADSEQAAIEQWKEHGGAFVSEEIEVQDLDADSAHAELVDEPAQPSGEKHE